MTRRMVPLLGRLADTSARPGRGAKADQADATNSWGAAPREIVDPLRGAGPSHRSGWTHTPRPAL